MTTRLPDDLEAFDALEDRLDRELAALAGAIVVRPDPARLLRHLDAVDARPARRPVGPRLLAAAAVALMVGSLGIVATRSPDRGDDPATTPTAPATTAPAATAAPPTTAPSATVATSVPPTVATSVTSAAPTTAASAVPPAAAPDTTVAPVDTAPAPEPDPAATAAPAPDTTAPPAPEPTAPPTTARPTVAFTAAQAFGSCDENPPYDEFSGTATPGSRITVSSPYGGGSVTADGTGHWWVRITFPTAPVGESFTVRVAGPQGQRTFGFVRTG